MRCRRAVPRATEMQVDCHSHDGGSSWAICGNQMTSLKHREPILDIAYKRPHMAWDSSLQERWRARSPAACLPLRIPVYMQATTPEPQALCQQLPHELGGMAPRLHAAMPVSTGSHEVVHCGHMIDR
jgi:hypothetical protein